MEEVEPGLLHMTHYEYVAWQWWGEGSYILPRFRLKWAIDAAAQKIDAEKRDDDYQRKYGTKRHALDDGQGEWRSLGAPLLYQLGEDGAYHKVREN